MAFLTPDPTVIGQTLAKTAAAKAALAVSQAMSPKLVSDVQRVLSTGSVAGQLLGLRTGIGAVDDLLGLTDVRDTATTLLGGLTLRQAQAIYDQSRSASVARKNLFFIRITDANPPAGAYQAAPPAQGGLAGLIQSRVGPAIGAVVGGISSAARTVAGALGAPGLVGSPNSIAAIAASCFDLLALDVSYGSSIQGDHIQVGAAFIDKATGTTPTEMQITTLDDERGTIKSWFDAKQNQVARGDGSFGLPAEYLVRIEVVHAIPSDQVPNENLAYRSVMRMRPQAIQLELSRRDQALAEIQLTFSEFDPFMGT